jgi:hypothetical protein
VLASFAVRRHPAASPRQIKNIRNYLEANPNAIAEDDNFMEDERDLISVEARPRSVARTLAERGNTDQYFLSASRSSTKVRYYDDVKYETFNTAVTLFLGLHSFVVPLWVIPLAGGMGRTIVTLFIVCATALFYFTTTWKLPTLLLTSIA